MSPKIVKMLKPTLSLAALLAAANALALDVTLQWQDNSDNEAGFYIERSANGSAFTRIGTVEANATTFTDTTAAPGAAYDYRVKAFGAQGVSKYSNTASFSEQVPTISNNGDAGQITLAWQDNSANEKGFTIERSANGGTFTQIGETAANVTRFTDANITFDVLYEYRIKAFNDTQLSEYTNTVSYIAKNTAPTISNILDLNAEYNSAFEPIAFTIGDQHIDASKLSVTLSSSNTSLINQDSVRITGDGATRTLYLNPVEGASGTSTITLTVSDGLMTSSKTFVVTVADQAFLSIRNVANLFGSPIIAAGDSFIASVDAIDPTVVTRIDYLINGELQVSAYQNAFDALLAIDQDGAAKLTAVAHISGQSATETASWTIQVAPAN